MAQKNGILLVDKPAGLTSHDVVNVVRRLSGQRRVGHTGTLDPSATGLLVLVLGKATRLSSWLTGYDKNYTGVIRFGIATDTLDADGLETERAACHFTASELESALKTLIGEIIQVPPKYSAIKVGGRPAYKLARAGADPKMPQRTVRVESFTVTDLIAGEHPAAHFQVKCSSGTYVRTLAADLGKALGCPAHLESLRRTRVGRFTVADSFTVEELQKKGVDTEEVPLTAMTDALEMPEYAASDDEVQLILTGRAVSGAGVSEASLDGTVIKMVAAGDGGLLGLGKVTAGTIKPFLVVREV